ncbi:MAG: asparagine synthase (glutamine-hydrolyzing) [Chloroflexi bacterium]|nr:asparagine synthase (glutamine-hydrolyzing) [Chloroflexota bacterium]
MCGICGIWNYKSREPVHRELLAAMTGTLVHRGPDAEGFHFDDAHGLGLGFRRLAIIDLSPAGNQPMPNEDETIWVVFNGEIYNFADLRPTLESRGHIFRSRADTEVIVHAYEERGAECIRDLNGMFAIALWDRRAQRLVLARDRLGKKPVYYYDDGARIIFASELKAILRDPSVPRELDFAALGNYLTYGYVPSPRAIFKQIHKLAPAHFLVLERGCVTTRRYWDLLPAFQSPAMYTESEWIEEIRVMLRAVVRDRLVSDVPLGVLLSGGVDSSAVAAAAAEATDHPIKTFSIGFAEKEFNELPYARAVAERFGTDHHELIVAPQSLREVMPRLAQQFDEPFADSSAVPTYYVSQMARQHVTVVLSGDGGDEMLAGYTRYARALQEMSAQRIPLLLRRALFQPLLKFLPEGIPGRRFALRMLLDPEHRYMFYMQMISRNLLGNLLTPEMRRVLLPGHCEYLGSLMEQARGLDFLSQIQFVDAVSYLPEDILVKVDRASMLTSLETRAPLLDYRFVELMASVPSNLRLRGGQGKWIFKRALRGWLPDLVLDRPKQGFGVPLRKWFHGELAEYMRAILLDSQTRARGLWRMDALERLLNGHIAHPRSLDGVIWTLLVLELWWREYNDATR